MIFKTLLQLATFASAQLLLKTDSLLSIEEPSNLLPTVLFHGLRQSCVGEGGDNNADFLRRVASSVKVPDGFGNKTIYTECLDIIGTHGAVETSLFMEMTK